MVEKAIEFAKSHGLIFENFLEMLMDVYGDVGIIGRQRPQRVLFFEKF